jgi:hypothetical protein
MKVTKTVVYTVTGMRQQGRFKTFSVVDDKESSRSVSILSSELEKDVPVNARISATNWDEVRTYLIIGKFY